MAYLGKGTVSRSNATTTALNTLTTYTGTYENVSAYSSVTVALLTDQNGILYVDFSPDGTNTDSTLSFNITASVNEVHRITVTRKFFRIRIYNSSASNQTYLRAQVLLGDQTHLTRPLNGVIQDDADTLVTSPVDFNLAVSDGRFTGRNFTIKDGINFDIDSGSVPEDVWGGGGTYTGFPATPAAAEIVVAGADTGTVYYSYMASNTDTDYTFGSKAVAGAGTYSLGHNIWRCNFAYFQDTATGVINVGDITIRHTATPANIFCVILAGYGQTYCAAYTVPYNSAVYIDRFQGNIRGSTSASMEGFVWYKPNGGSPYLRFPFELQFGTLYFDDVDYAIKIPALVDFIPRITYSSTNNLVAKFSFRLLKVKQ